MKKAWMVLGAGLVIAVAVFLGFQWVGGGQGANPVAAAQSTLAPVKADGDVICEGEVVPADDVTLTFSGGGLVDEVLVVEGDQKKAGDVLIVSDSLYELQSAVKANQQALASAQKTYENLMANAPLKRANAQLALIQAQKDIDDAVDDTESYQFQRASQETIDIARARLITANEALDQAEDFFDSHSGDPESVTYAAALDQLAKARQLQTQAQWNLNYVAGLPEPLDVEEVEVKLDVAEARLLAAKAEWEMVKDGPNDPAIVAAQAQVASAQANLDTAQAALERAVIRAPFDGTVATLAVKPGQMVTPGQPLVTYADLNNLRVETTDLSELDVAKVQVGQSALVTITGLDVEIPAQVVAIASTSTKLSGDVVYQVTLQLSQQPAGLRWGMTTTVRFLPVQE